jgi:hypothetical protein
MKRLLPLFLLLLAPAGCDDALGPDRNAESGIPLAAPEQPSLTARNASIDVAFTTVATATGYELYYAEGDPPAAAPQKWEAGLENAEGTRLVTGSITGLVNGTTYTVWTKAVYAYGVSGFSESAAATPIPPPPMPSPPTVNQSDTGQLELSWTAVTGAESYVIYYSTNGAALIPDRSHVDDVLNESFLLKGLEDTTYYISLAARNSAGESEPSTQVSQTVTAAASAPGVPAKPSLAKGPNRLTVSWNGVPTASSYIVYYKPASGGAVPDGASSIEQAAALPAVSVRIDGLVNGTNYYVWVKAKNSRGPSADFSPSNNETPQDKPALNMNNSNFVVGKAAAAFSAGGDRGWRKKETSVGNLFADSSVWYVRKKYPAETIDFALLPSRIVSAGHPKGTMTVRSITAIQNTGSYGYDWSLIILTLTGRQVIDLFRVAADIPRNGGGGHPTGGFHLISGEARHTIDYTTKEPNTRGVTKDLVINGVTLVQNHVPTTDPALLNKNYRVVTMAYLAQGVDDYTYYDEVYQYALSDRVSTGISTREAIAFFVYDHDEPVQPVIDGRITLIGGVVIP